MCPSHPYPPRGGALYLGIQLFTALYLEWALDFDNELLTEKSLLEEMVSDYSAASKDTSYQVSK